MMIQWKKPYTDKKILKEEISVMCNSFLKVLLSAVPKSEVAGIYFKGSGQKPWDSPVDYVPEISDIDIHILLKKDSLVKRYFGTTEQALAVQAQVEELYFSNKPHPVHVPRPQIVFLNPAIKDKDFVPSPPNTIKVLYGKPYPLPDETALKRLQQIDRKRLLDEVPFLKEYPNRVIDRPSKYLWQAVRNLVWHISPIGSRVLSIKGKSYEEAWGINRTNIIRKLSELGEKQLVRDYSQFYLNSWDYFLSQYADTNAGRGAIVAGIHALTRAIEIAKD
jgi:hypothetical protein